MHELVVGTVATGEGAFRPGRDFTPVSEFPDEPQDNISNMSRRLLSVLSYTREVEVPIIIPFPYGSLNDNKPVVLVHCCNGHCSSVCCTSWDNHSVESRWKWM